MNSSYHLVGTQAFSEYFFNALFHEALGDGEKLECAHFTDEQS